MKIFLPTIPSICCMLATGLTACSHLSASRIEFDLEDQRPSPAMEKTKLVVTDYCTAGPNARFAYSKVALNNPEKPHRIWIYSICAPDTGHYCYSFPDGTEIDLAPGSQIEYSSKFLTEEPYLVIWGRAHVITKRHIYFYCMNAGQGYEADGKGLTKINICQPPMPGWEYRVGVDGIVHIFELGPIPHSVDRSDLYKMFRMGIKHQKNRVVPHTQLTTDPIVSVTPVLDTSEMAPEPLISFHATNMPLLEALQQLHYNIGYQIIYERKAVERSKAISVSIDKVPWTKALEELFKGQDSISFTCDTYGKKIVFGRYGSTFPTYDANQFGGRSLPKDWSYFINMVFPKPYGLENFANILREKNSNNN